MTGDREIRAFDEGELWLDDEASPIASPAGWYVRRRKASHPAWIGPFASAAAAADATLTGDPLRDARRRLELWARRHQPADRAAVATEPGESVVSVVPPPPAPARSAEAAPAVADASDGGGERPPAKAAARLRGRRADPRQIDLPF
jgi:hypothetical protein